MKLNQYGKKHPIRTQQAIEIGNLVFFEEISVYNGKEHKTNEIKSEDISFIGQMVIGKTSKYDVPIGKERYYMNPENIETNKGEYSRETEFVKRFTYLDNQESFTFKKIKTPENMEKEDLLIITENLLNDQKNAIFNRKKKNIKDKVIYNTIAYELKTWTAVISGIIKILFQPFSIILKFFGLGFVAPFIITTTLFKFLGYLIHILKIKELIKYYILTFKKYIIYSLEKRKIFFFFIIQILQKIFSPFHTILLSFAIIFYKATKLLLPEFSLFKNKSKGQPIAVGCYASYYFLFTFYIIFFISFLNIDLRSYKTINFKKLSQSFQFYGVNIENFEMLELRKLFESCLSMLNILFFIFLSIAILYLTSKFRKIINIFNKKIIKPIGAFISIYTIQYFYGEDYNHDFIPFITPAEERAIDTKFRVGSLDLLEKIRNKRQNLGFQIQAVDRRYDFQDHKFLRGIYWSKGQVFKRSRMLTNSLETYGNIGGHNLRFKAFKNSRVNWLKQPKSPVVYNIDGEEITYRGQIPSNFKIIGKVNPKVVINFLGNENYKIHPTVTRYNIYDHPILREYSEFGIEEMSKTPEELERIALGLLPEGITIDKFKKGGDGWHDEDTVSVVHFAYPERFETWIYLRLETTLESIYSPTMHNYTLFSILRFIIFASIFPADYMEDADEDIDDLLFTADDIMEEHEAYFDGSQNNFVNPHFSHNIRIRELRYPLGGKDFETDSFGLPLPLEDHFFCIDSYQGTDSPFSAVKKPFKEYFGNFPRTKTSIIPDNENGSRGDYEEQISDSRYISGEEFLGRGHVDAAYDLSKNVEKGINLHYDSKFFERKRTLLLPTRISSINRILKKSVPQEKLEGELYTNIIDSIRIGLSFESDLMTRQDFVQGDKILSNFNALFEDKDIYLKNFINKIPLQKDLGVIQKSNCLYKDLENFITMLDLYHSKVVLNSPCDYLDYPLDYRLYVGHRSRYREFEMYRILIEGFLKRENIDIHEWIELYERDFIRAKNPTLDFRDLPQFSQRKSKKNLNLHKFTSYRKYSNKF